MVLGVVFVHFLFSNLYMIVIFKVIKCFMREAHLCKISDALGQNPAWPSQESTADVKYNCIHFQFKILYIIRWDFGLQPLWPTS